jgi:hypothetical protein
MRSPTPFLSEIHGELIGNLDVPRIEYPKCGRSGRVRSDIVLHQGRRCLVRDENRVNSQFSASSCTQGLEVVIFSPTSDGGGGGLECSAVNGTGSWSGNQNRWGWMAGVGLEFGLFGN